MTYEVVLRFVFELPTFWAYELAYMLTGAHFSLGVAYVTRENAHVRVDFLYARFSAKTQAGIDGAIGLLFIIPVVTWMTSLLISTAMTSYEVGEVSGQSVWNPVLWPLHWTIALGFVFFSLQLVVETIKKFLLVCGRELDG